MRLGRIALITLLGLCSQPAQAESFVAAVADYYKERSTRVMAPSIVTQLELPDDWRVGGRVLVDQITSASGAFTATDEPFTERRYEVGVNVDTRLQGWLRPGVTAKYSTESDYTSVTGGGSLTALLNNELSTITGALQYQHDWVGRRTSDNSSGARQQGADEFAEQLQTLYLSLAGTQIVNRNLIVGATLKIEVMRGYLENVYRQEQHPRAREDYALGFFLRHRNSKAGLGFILETCLHASSWGHYGVSNQVEVWWTVNRILEVVPFIRHYEQPNGPFFEMGAERPDPDNPGGDPISFNTQDPTLTGHRTVQVGGRLVFTVRGLRNLKVIPSYFFRYQNTAYGNAHIAQLGLYWPFSL